MYLVTRSRARAAIVAACLMGLGVAGCGGSGSDGTGSGGPITIGASVGLTGEQSLPQLVTGYKQAVAEVNDAGGIQVGATRRKVKLSVLDNRSDPNLLGNQVNELVLKDHAVALVSGCCALNVFE